MPVSIIILNI